MAVAGLTFDMIFILLPFDVCIIHSYIILKQSADVRPGTVVPHVRMYGVFTVIHTDACCFTEVRVEVDTVSDRLLPTVRSSL